ncbi:acyl carrier protein [Azospirillum halopraeferens]|uniref:acyl carrier protein n=1 Tax=Azospirillum halopraeferens TaxID=34010 RepID=UPI0003FCDFE2|nr:phosphopantetheine-binding protein [Azospirillum halopraeferens]
MAAVPSPFDPAILDALGSVAPDADLSALDPDQPFRDQFEFDSVDFLNFILKLETRFDLHAEELDYPRLTTLAGCRAYLAEHAAQD